MASKILSGGEDEGITDSVVVNTNGEADAPSRQAAESHKPTQESKPQPSAGAVKSNKAGMSGLLADKGSLATYGVLGIVVVAFLFYLLSDDAPQQPKNAGGFASGSRSAPPPASSAAISSEAVNQLSSVLLQQRNQIETLSQQVQQVGNMVAQQQGQISQLEQRLALSSVAGTTAPVAPEQRRGYLNSTLISNMKINDIQPDLVWVRYGGKVYALQVGDSLGGTKVVQIDLHNRVVVTTNGLIR